MTRNWLTRNFPHMTESMIRKNLMEDVLKPGDMPMPEMSVKVEKRKTTDEENLNRWEAQWLAVLRKRPYIWIGIQNVTWKLAADTRYTPDFVVVVEGVIQAHEVKGFMRDDALVKIKVAARMFPWVEFVLVTKDGKSWKESVVKP